MTRSNFAFSYAHATLANNTHSFPVKVKKFETEIDAVEANDAPEFERLLRRMRYFLHPNHYWILDVKRRLIDIYGNKPEYELYKLPLVR